MSCSNLKVNCSGNCFTNCCNVNCPPDGLCDWIDLSYRAGSNTAQYPCECPRPFTKKIFDFMFRKKQKNETENKIKQSDLDGNSKLGIEVPPIPSFELSEDLIKNTDTNFIFAQGCSVPCNSISVRITTSNSCGISLSGSVGGSKCCCAHGVGKVYASISGGGDCEASLSWTEQSVSNGGSVSFPTVNLANSCCSLFSCGSTCGSNTPLWNKKVVGNKLKITLNKKEFLKRANRMKDLRINARRNSKKCS